MCRGNLCEVCEGRQFYSNSISPTEKLPQTPIEERIEARLLMMMNSVVPQIVVRQCDDKPDVTCALLLYRTMVHAGPASKEDCAQMMDILTKPKTYELSKLQEAMIQFRYARTRLKKYGHIEPEPSQLFETLKVAASALTAKNHEFAFRFQHYIMKHSSVNGLVSEQTVQEMYDMIVDNARGFVDGSPNPETKAAQARPQDRKRGYEQTGQKPQEMTCFNCGAKDHFWRECPKKSNSNTPPPNQETGQPYKAGPKRTGKGVPKRPPPKRGERGAKGSGRRTKEGPKNETPKSRPKRPPTPPGARAAQEWDEEPTEGPPEESGYEEQQTENPEYWGVKKKVTKSRKRSMSKAMTKVPKKNRRNLPKSISPWSRQSWII